MVLEQDKIEFSEEPKVFFGKVLTGIFIQRLQIGKVNV